MLALGRNNTGEPLSSEDMALLAAVAGQIATALENARLYRQLHVKAVELDRLRAFNENILESLDDGCWWSTSTIASCAGTARSSSCTACAATTRSAGRCDDCSTAVRRAIRAARRERPAGATSVAVPLPHPARRPRGG